MTRIATATLALAVALLPAATLGAPRTIAPAYVGTWGDAASCKLPQDDQGAPMIIKAGGYDRHETHCTFSGLKKKGNTWSGRETCTVEGSKQRGKITMTVDGDTLTIDEGPGPRTLSRCQ